MQYPRHHASLTAVICACTLSEVYNDLMCTCYAFAVCPSGCHLLPAARCNTKRKRRKHHHPSMSPRFSPISHLPVLAAIFHCPLSASLSSPWRSSTRSTSTSSVNYGATQAAVQRFATRVARLRGTRVVGLRTTETSLPHCKEETHVADSTAARNYSAHVDGVSECRS